MTRLQTADAVDLAAIARSGQCFRWEETPDGWWRVPHRDRCLYLRQHSPHELSAEGADEETFRAYLDLDTSYADILSRIDPADACLTEAAGQGRGIRILRQDPWETLISFIISQNKNIPAIRRCVERLAEAAGEEHLDGRGRPYHAFPGPGAVLSLGEKGLRACALGYRAPYVLSAARRVAEGALSLSALQRAPWPEARLALLSLDGVGEKVAGCVALFGLHQLNAFPVDVWIRRVLSEHYPQGFPFERYTPWCGVYQQYLFAWAVGRKRQ